MHHILGDVGLSVEEDGERLRGTADVVPNMRVPGTTSLRLSILATWADTLLGLLAARSAAPAVPVTLELDVHIFEDVPTAGTVDSVARLLKAGRSVTVTAIDFANASGRRVGFGHGLMMDSGLTTRGGRSALDTFSARRGVLDEPFAKRAGCQRLAPGLASLPCADHLLNSAKTLNGGLLALVVEEAVLSADPGSSICSVSLKYLRPVRRGPATARAEVHRGVATVEVHDADNDALAVIATTRAFARPEHDTVHLAADL
jgi:acyl-coenzyme A thioesterase PaaI-like protein